MAKTRKKLPAPPRKPASGARQIAFLRGINVGGRHRIAMADLAGMFARAGCEDVETYIQSGNVLFRVASGTPAEAIAAVERDLSRRLGAEIPVIVRSARDLAAVLRANPFLAAGVAPEALHVAFLKDRPAAGLVAALDRERGSPDAFEVRGREIYLHLPNGAARTKLTNDWFDRALRTKSTLRNWRTTLALVELALRRTTVTAPDAATAGTPRSSAPTSSRSPRGRRA